jgi:acyl carrier protein
MTGATYPETEKRLLELWSEVLNLSNIGRNDDFFSLGGDSMAAMLCINRIIAAFGVELPIDLFLLKSASIAEVASEIARRRSRLVQK